MSLVASTDQPYQRDFYHWVLQGHFSGPDPPNNEGFQWYVEGGPVNTISIGYPKTPFWYELGNGPDYLGSRKIYYYRAWVDWYVGEILYIHYGSWVQFTSINPMCTGFTNFEAKKMMRKYYSYHGEIRLCPIQPEPGTFECEPARVPGLEWILVYDWSGYYGGLKIVKWNITTWLPSSDDDLCAEHFPDGKKRYVFWEYDIHHVPRVPPAQSLYTDGNNCTQVTWKMEGDYYYRASFNTVYYASSWIMGIAFPFHGSRIRVWKSLNGENPGYSPI